MKHADSCVFCAVERDAYIVESRHAFSFYDRFPSSKGHALVVPKVHVHSIFTSMLNQAPEIRDDVWSLVKATRTELMRIWRPDAFTIGINDGGAAGQTIQHAHIHVIPRYAGDVEDPRGGVRWVIPETAAYWEEDA